MGTILRVCNQWKTGCLATVPIVSEIRRSFGGEDALMIA
jgi:hypothetical protein